ncbi:MAG TPA: hypothetical protein VHI13_21995 [Candidatus Kapabacteria bacterium]|nr:hypothetical protein [Candidatus Kapabacteria bacterium]
MERSDLHSSDTLWSRFSFFDQKRLSLQFPVDSASLQQAFGYVETDTTLRELLTRPESPTPSPHLSDSAQVAVLGPSGYGLPIETAIDSTKLDLLDRKDTLFSKARILQLGSHTPPARRYSITALVILKPTPPQTIIEFSSLLSRSLPLSERFAIWNGKDFVSQPADLMRDTMWLQSRMRDSVPRYSEQSVESALQGLSETARRDTVDTVRLLISCPTCAGIDTLQMHRLEALIDELRSRRIVGKWGELPRIGPDHCGHADRPVHCRRRLTHRRCQGSMHFSRIYIRDLYIQRLHIIGGPSRHSRRSTSKKSFQPMHQPRLNQLPHVHTDERGDR